MPKPNLNPPPHYSDFSEDIWKRWFERVYVRLGENSEPFPIKGIAKAGLADASNHGTTSGTPYTSIVFVPDATGGAALAFSDGTNWISTVTGSAV